MNIPEAAPSGGAITMHPAVAGSSPAPGSDRVGRRIGASLLLLAATLILASGFWLAGAAVAPGPAEAARGGGKLIAAPKLIKRGQAVRIVGRAWTPRSRIKLGIGQPQSGSFPIGTVRVNRRGRFVKRVRVRGLPGRYVLTACRANLCVRGPQARAGLRVLRR